MASENKRDITPKYENEFDLKLKVYPNTTDTPNKGSVGDIQISYNSSRRMFSPRDQVDTVLFELAHYLKWSIMDGEKSKPNKSIHDFLKYSDHNISFVKYTPDAKDTRDKASVLAPTATSTATATATALVKVLAAAAVPPAAPPAAPASAPVSASAATTPAPALVGNSMKEVSENAKTVAEYAKTVAEYAKTVAEAAIPTTPIEDTNNPMIPGGANTNDAIKDANVAINSANNAIISANEIVKDIANNKYPVNIVYDVSPKPKWLHFTPKKKLIPFSKNVLSGQPPENTKDTKDTGSYTIQLKADISGNTVAQQKFDIEVINTKKTPLRFTSSPITTAIAGQVYSYKITTTNSGNIVDNNNVNITTTSKLPDWLALSNNVLSTGQETVEDEIGKSYEIKLQAEISGNIVAQQNFNIEVVDNTSLRFTSAPITNADTSCGDFNSLLCKYKYIVTTNEEEINQEKKDTIKLANEIFNAAKNLVYASNKYNDAFQIEPKNPEDELNRNILLEVAHNAINTAQDVVDKTKDYVENEKTYMDAQKKHLRIKNETSEIKTKNDNIRAIAKRSSSTEASKNAIQPANTEDMVANNKLTQANENEQNSLKDVQTAKSEKKKAESTYKVAINKYEDAENKIVTPEFLKRVYNRLPNIPRLWKRSAPTSAAPAPAPASVSGIAPPPATPAPASVSGIAPPPATPAAPRSFFRNPFGSRTGGSKKRLSKRQRVRKNVTKKRK